MTPLYERTAGELSRLVHRGDVSPTEILRSCLDRIERLNPLLNAFVHLCPERAFAEARAQEQALAAGRDPGPLAGIPLGVKDLEDAAGLPTTFGSVPFRDRVAVADSVQVGRLRAAGAIVVGKTNTPEFGHTGFTKNRLFGTTRNPWDPELTPGGSSGGSAAAIAARMVPLATASDGGGSIRIPASFVGAFGFKPTFGRIPQGPEPFALLRWVDTVHQGPLVRSVEDAALFLDVTAGYHPADPTSLPRPAEAFADALRRPLGKLRVAVSVDLGYAVVSAEVRRAFDAAVAVFEALGHEVVRVDLDLPDMGRAWAFACGAEQYGELASAVEGREGDLGRAFWSGLSAASALDARKLGAIQRERFSLNAALEELFGRYDLLLTPTMPLEPFAAAGPPPSAIDGQPLASPLQAVAFTYPFNFSGHPAATVRAGFTAAGLPAGLQIIAERHRDALVLQAAAAFHAERPMSRWPEPSLG